MHAMALLPKETLRNIGDGIPAKQVRNTDNGIPANGRRHGETLIMAILPSRSH